ncbi:hypothetical protein [Frankia sp. CcWB2]
MAFVACVQFGFHGRAVLYSKQDVEAWGRISDLDPDVDEHARAQVQRADMETWPRWYRRCQRTYNAGIVLLAVGVAIIMTPPASYSAGTPLSGAETGWRWAGFGVAILAALAELTVILRDEHANRALRNRTSAT